jgi:hypothetical protein
MARHTVTLGSLTEFHIFESTTHFPFATTLNAALNNIMGSDANGNFTPGGFGDFGGVSAPGGLTDNVLPKSLSGAGLTLTDSNITDTGSLITLASAATITGALTTSGGRIVNVTYVSSTPYAILATDHDIHVDTDSAAITVNLPAGVEGTYYRIVNVGSSSNLVTIAPNGSEHLLGANSNFTLNDAESLVIVYHATEGWY